MTGEAACRYVFRIQSPLHLIHSSDRFLTRIVLIEPTRLGRFSLAFRRSDQSFQRPAVVARSDQDLAIRALGVRMPPGSAKPTNRVVVSKLTGQVTQMDRAEADSHEESEAQVLRVDDGRRKPASGFEPPTSSLGSWHSTTESRPQRRELPFSAYYRGFPLPVKSPKVSLDTPQIV